MTYIKPVAGLPSFAMVSAVSIVDPLLSASHRRVLSILALHAGRSGKTDPGQERIASLAGWYTKDKEGNKVPNKHYVSSLINNVNHAKKSDRYGPGLVQLGYVKPGHMQKGFNQTNTYYLTTPTFSDGEIHRPDGTKTPASFTAPPKREEDKAYKARKSAQLAAHELEQIAPREKFTEADQLPLDLAETYCWMGDEYTCKDCGMDLINWQNGFERDVPDEVYRYFKIKVPAKRDAAY